MKRLPLQGRTLMLLVVIRFLNDMARQFETAIIVVTHDGKLFITFAMA